MSHTFVSNARNPLPKPVGTPTAGLIVPRDGKSGNAATRRPLGAAPAQPPSPPTTPPAPFHPAPLAGLPDAERIAQEAHGDVTLEALLADSEREWEALQRQIDAANADDPKAEAMKWRLIADVASRRHDEVQGTLVAREATLRWLTNTLRRIGRAIREENPNRVAAAVEKFIRRVKVEA